MDYSKTSPIINPPYAEICEVDEVDKFANSRKTPDPEDFRRHFVSNANVTASEVSPSAEPSDIDSVPWDYPSPSEVIKNEHEARMKALDEELTNKR